MTSLIDDVRAYWNQRPCNIKHSAKPIDTREFSEEVTKKKYFVEPHIKVFADFRSWSGMRVLEIGCGIGTDTLQFAAFGAQVIAVDVSEESLRVARLRARVMGLDHRISFVHGDAECLDMLLPNVAEFDLIYSFGVIHHSPNPHRILESARAYSHRHTRIKVMVYHRNSLKAWGLQRYRRLGMSFDEAVAIGSEAQTGCPITYTYTPEKARQMFVATGWDVESIKIDHIFPWQIEPYKRGEYRRRWLYGISARWFQYLEQRVGWHLLIEGRRSAL